MASAARLAQSDVRQRTVLPQMLHGRQLHSATNADDMLSSDEYLDKMEEELNKRVDEHIDVLRDGMADLVRLTDVSTHLDPSVPLRTPGTHWDSSRHSTPRTKS